MLEIEWKVDGNTVSATTTARTRIDGSKSSYCRISDIRPAETLEDAKKRIAKSLEKFVEDYRDQEEADAKIEARRAEHRVYGVRSDSMLYRVDKKKGGQCSNS